MAFKTEAVKFTLKDVGSEIIDQLSSDIYTGPSAILRELVKNAYDAYLALDRNLLDDDEEISEIHIKRRRDGSSGHLMITDKGIGQTIEDLKGNLQIGISSKRNTLAHATGFRGLGSWAILGAGSSIVITSTKQGVGEKVRLEIDVRKVYGLLSPTASLDEILNNSKCIKFSKEGNTDPEEHYTVVDIICDGPTVRVGAYEINRVYPYTDPHERELASLLIKSCPIPFASDSTIYEKLKLVYEESGYEPTTLTLDGEALVRRLPAGLTNYRQRRLTIGDKTAAIAWTVEDPTKSREIKNVDENQHRLLGPSLQLLKYNVPLGEPGKFADPKLRTLKWYLGEVHVIADDLRPNAGGDDFRAGSAREAFIEALKTYYNELEERAEERSQRLSLVRSMNKGKEAALKLAKNNFSPTDRARLEKQIADAVDKITLINSRRTPKTATEKRVAAVKMSPNVLDAKTSCLKVLKESGHWTKFTAKASVRSGQKATANRTSKERSNSGRAATVSSITGRPLTAEQLQAGLGRAVPRLREELGLTEQQIEGLFEILADIFREV